MFENAWLQRCRAYGAAKPLGGSLRSRHNLITRLSCRDDGRRDELLGQPSDDLSLSILSTPGFMGMLECPPNVSDSLVGSEVNHESGCRQPIVMPLKRLPNPDAI